MTLPPIVKDKMTALPFAASIAFLLVALCVAYIAFADTGGLLIVHFDAYRGIDFLGNADNVFGIIAISAAAVAVNAFLADELYWRERFLAYIMAAAAALFSLLILIAVFAIVSIN